MIVVKETQDRKSRVNLAFDEKKLMKQDGHAWPCSTLTIVILSGLLSHEWLVVSVPSWPWGTYIYSDRSCIKELNAVVILGCNIGEDYINTCDVDVMAEYEVSFFKIMGSFVNKMAKNSIVHAVFHLTYPQSQFFVLYLKTRSSLH